MHGPPYSLLCSQNRWLSILDGLIKLVASYWEKKQLKIASYADDVLLYLTKPETSLPDVITFLNNIAPLSGCKLNIENTEIIFFGRLSEKLKHAYPLKWKTESFKYLGVFLHQDFSEIIEKNYNSLYSDGKKDLERWNNILLLSIGARI